MVGGVDIPQEGFRFTQHRFPNWIQFLDFRFGLLAAGMGAESAARAGAALLGLLGSILVVAPGPSARRRICGFLEALIACVYATLTESLATGSTATCEHELFSLPGLKTADAGGSKE